MILPFYCDCEVISSIAIKKNSKETPTVNLYSADTVKNNDGADNQNNALYPTEFINSLNVNGLLLHNLELKINKLVMFLRNIDVNLGLCNGTTMRTVPIINKIIKVQIRNGSHIGDYALIPRIELKPSVQLYLLNFHDVNFP